MNDFIIYLFKSGLLISVFYVVYIVLLRKETYYNFNRAYLLVTLFLSFVLPFISIQVQQVQVLAENNFVIAEQVFLEATHYVARAEQHAVDNAMTYPWIYYALFTGMIIGALRIGYQLVGIYINIKKHKIKTGGKYRYVLTDKRHSTHSFFNFIFIHKEEYTSTKSKEVMLHEQVHADQWHSLDLLVVGMLSILQWFNPFMFLYKRALTETHEYQADQALIDNGTDKIYYQQLLLQQARSLVFSGLTSTFNQSLIKNRLKMMNKIKSSKRALIKYLLVLPLMLCIGIFFAVSQDNFETSIAHVLSVENTNLVFASENEIMYYMANDSIRLESGGGIIALFGNAKVVAKNTSFESDEIYIIKNENLPTISPINYQYIKVVTGFGMRMHPILKTKKMHYGIDISANPGTPVRATAHGKVRNVEFDKAKGKQVIIDHGNGYSTGYNHLKNYIVEAGQFVKCGDVIGYVGITGLSAKPHLHYEVMKDGKYVNPQDYLRRIEN